MSKLQNQDLRVLQMEVGKLKEELDEMKEQWNELKKPISTEIAQQKQDLSDMKVEYKYKMDKIKDTQKGIKEALEDLAHKKEVLAFLNDQWEKMPKDVNRNQYLKRIHEIIENLKKQKEDIRQVLEDIKGVQQETD